MKTKKWNKTISGLEKLLGKRIKKNTLAIGVDLASNITGFSLLKSDDKKVTLVDTDYIDLSKYSKGDKRYIKMDLFMLEVEEFCKRHKINEYENTCIYIEDCFFGRSIESFQRLCEYHALFYATVKKYCDNVYFILPNIARANIKFSNKNKVKSESVKALVHHHLIKNFKYKDESDYREDIMDAFVLALVALIDDDDIWKPVVKHRKKKAKTIRKKYTKKKVVRKVKKKKVVKKQ